MMTVAPKILVVDDDKLVRDLYGAEFRNVGFDVATAKDGEEALEKLPSFNPNVVLLDIMMPSIHGFQVLDIARNTPSVKKAKIVVFTALGDSDAREKAQDLGADGYLVKAQTTMKEVVEYVQKLLEVKE